MKKFIVPNLFCIMLSSAVSALFAETYYFTGGQVGDSLNNTYTSWSTYNEALGDYEPATGPIPIDEIGGAETVLRRMESINYLIKNQMSGIDATNVYLKSIIYESNVFIGDSGGYDWVFYTNVGGGTCDMSVGNISVTADIGSGQNLRIRKRQADANLNLTLREGASVMAGGLCLGYKDKGEFLTKLTLGADSNGVVFNINGANASIQDPKIVIYANEIEGLGADQAYEKLINIEKGTLSFEKATQGDSPTPLSNQNADLSGTVINLGKAAYFNYGANGNSMSGWIKLGDVNVSGTTSDVYGTGLSNNDRSRMNFYTTATVGDTPGSAPVQVGTITLDSLDPSNDLSRLDFYTNANAYIEKIVSANNGGDNSFQGIALNGSSTGNVTITVGSIDIAVRRISMTTDVLVQNDFVSSYVNASDSTVATNVAITSGKTLTILGNIVPTGAMNFDIAATSGSVKVTVGGISGGANNYLNRLTTTYTSSNGVETLFVINGDFDSEFSGRIHDMGQNSSLDSMVGRNYFSIQKDGAGTQILRGDMYIRGTTTLNEGELYIRADARADWGLGQVVLNGGKFGAIGADADIGKILAKDLTWSNESVIAVDVAADGTCDLISLSGNFLKAEGDGDGLYTFEFNGTFAAGETMYKILSWAEDSEVNFSESDFAYTYGDSGRSAMEGHFVMQDNSLYFVAVPEPAEYAALFGALALGFAFLRRRRK